MTISRWDHAVLMRKKGLARVLAAVGRLSAGGINAFLGKNGVFQGLK
jgi:hypothetical protein